MSNIKRITIKPKLKFHKKVMRISKGDPLFRMGGFAPMAGEFAARKLIRKRKKYRWRKAVYKNKVLHIKKKKDPLGGSPQAKGIVLEKRMVEQKQPHSGLLKCVRVRLMKNGKQITAFVPRTGAINHIAEHDQVVVEGLGGSQGGAVGSLSGVKWRVVKVNNIALEMVRTGRKQKPTR